MPTHYPKAGRCQACTKRLEDCSALPFETMPVHRRDGQDVAVICTEFRQINHGASLRAVPRSNVDPFSMAEQAAILAAAPKDRRPQIQFALWTGLRPSELIALEWGDIDWIGNEIRIVRAKTRAASEPESPKTTSGRRSVKLLAPAREALLQQKAATFLAGGRIFTNPVSGAPWDHSEQIRKLLWAPVMKKSGVRYRRPYQTRHTYASMMLSAGEHPMWVAKQMGHKDWTMIARVYGRWMPSADLEAGQKAVQLFAGNDSTMTTMGIDPALLAGARKDTRLAL
ncbi:site-specific integrase [Ectopseudomonas mendocina]|nr:site-specific integrase [Pseudomonas mendocina]